MRSMGMTGVTPCRRCLGEGGLKTGQMHRMKELELENQRLRKAVADLTLDKLNIVGAARKNCLDPRMAFVPVSSISS